MICIDCEQRYHGNNRSCPACGSPNVRKELEKTREIANNALENANIAIGIASQANYTAKEAMREAKQNLKSLGIASGIVVGVMTGCEMIQKFYQHQYLQYTMYFCGVLLAILLIALILSFRRVWNAWGE